MANYVFKARINGVKQTIPVIISTDAVYLVDDKDTSLTDKLTQIAQDLASKASTDYLESTFATKSEVSVIPKFSIEVVAELPVENISDSTIYLVKGDKEDTQNLYVEYIHVNDVWEKLGEQKLDLSGYATVESVTEIRAEVKKVEQRIEETVTKINATDGLKVDNNIGEVTITLDSVNVNKLIQTPGENLILNCGTPIGE